MRTLVVRLDNAGDVLLCGPAVRAVAAGSAHVTLLAGPEGAAAARLLPGVDDVLVWRAPWAGFEPPAVDRDDVSDLVARLTGFDRAVILTSFHQSPLPAALLLRLAGVGHIAAICEDYPGSLLDVRHRTEDDIPEAERALSLARAAGFRLPPGDDGRLAVRRPLPHSCDIEGRYVVVHPGVSVPARAWPAGHCATAVRHLAARGWRPVVTGGPGERALTSRVAGDSGLDLGGRTTFAELAGVLEGASAVVAGNTGPAHLAAAVGTPVVSLFAPVVPAIRWAPYGVRHVLLGDQDAPCRDTRARECPVPGHPCLTSVEPADVVAAVEEVVG
ncbi:MAG: ADP-heptose:LPS heptosyltransferase [Actinoallomurus sp.]|nr:ADP-heptose:LPS heptosyltransferase [Actinoallomurus sp.]